MPLALRGSGWYGLIVLVLVMSIATYTGILLGRPFNQDQSLMNYDDLGSKCYPRWGRILTAICQIATLVGVSIIFLILAGEFLRSLLHDAVPHVNNLEWTVICAAVLLPFCFLRTLSETWWIALLGMTASTIAIVCILVGAIQHGKLPDVKYDDITFTSFIQSFTKFAFAFSAHPVFPSVQRSMKDRSKFSLAVFISLGFAFILYALTATVSYAMFGEETQGNIYVNIGLQSVPATIGMIALVFHLLFAFVIILNPVFINLEKHIGLGLEIRLFNWRRKFKHANKAIAHQISSPATVTDSIPTEDTKDPSAFNMSSPVDTSFQPHEKSSNHINSNPKKHHFFARILPQSLKKYALILFYFLERTLLVAFIAFIAVLIPFFTNLMDLIGGTTVTLTTFIMPIIFYWKLNNSAIKLWQKILNVGILILAIAIGVTSSVFAIETIIQNAGTYGIFSGH
jgi:amino acid permease